MKRILATTAIVALTALPLSATAQTTTGTMGGSTAVTAPMYTNADGAQISVSALMGRTVFIPREGEAQTGMMTDLTDAPDTWDNVADIEDILVNQDGQIASVLIDAGGFLGIGEKRTRVAMENLQLVPDMDDEGEYFVVYTGTRQLIEESETYDEAAARVEGYQPLGGMNYADNTATEGGIADGEGVRAGMTEIMSGEITAEQLDGLRVYGSNDEWLGEIGELVMSADGQIEQVIVDVGGFLGLGEKPVALQFDDIRFMRTDGGDDLAAYVPMTEEQLDAITEWTRDM